MFTYFSHTSRCTKCESLLYIFSFACQAHLWHGLRGGMGRGVAVIHLTTYKKKEKRENTNYGKWAQILMKFNNKNATETDSEKSVCERESERERDGKGQYTRRDVNSEILKRH